MTAAAAAVEPLRVPTPRAAWWDGWGQSYGLPPDRLTRGLNARELTEWRDGWNFARAQQLLTAIRRAAS